MQAGFSPAAAAAMDQLAFNGLPCTICHRLVNFAQHANILRSGIAVHIGYLSSQLQGVYTSEVIRIYHLPSVCVHIVACCWSNKILCFTAMISMLPIAALGSLRVRVPAVHGPRVHAVPQAVMRLQQVLPMMQQVVIDFVLWLRPLQIVNVHKCSLHLLKCLHLQAIPPMI